MSDEVQQELERHIQILESQLGWESEAGEELAELSDKIAEMTSAFDENATALTAAFDALRAALDRNTDKLNELINATARRKK
jgi:hypothetical protein